VLKQTVLIWAISILAMGLLIAYSHERAENLNYKKVLLDCINEKPFMFNADKQIGIVCFRDKQY